MPLLYSPRTHVHHQSTASNSQGFRSTLFGTTIHPSLLDSKYRKRHQIETLNIRVWLDLEY
jgi:hypothetical protein